MATKRALLILGLAYALVFGAIGLTLAELLQVTNGFGILDFSPGYDDQQVVATLDSDNQSG